MSDPKILTVTEDNADYVVQTAADALNAGALVVIPTETVYGVAANAGLTGALELIYEAKGRDSNKPVPLLAAGIDDVVEYGAEINNLERAMADKFWPGPLTLVLKVNDRQEGFRVPDHDVARLIVKSAGGVLRVTSANKSGEPAAMNVDDAVEPLKEYIAVAVDSGLVKDGVPSTVVRVEAGEIKILRQGVLTLEDLKSAI